MSALAADRVAAVIPWLMAALTANTIFAACAALVIVGLLCLLRVRSPSILYLGWSLVLVRMALPPGLSAAFSLRSFLERAWRIFSTRWPGWRSLDWRRIVSLCVMGVCFRPARWRPIVTPVACSAQCRLISLERPAPTSYLG